MRVGSESDQDTLMKCDKMKLIFNIEYTLFSSV